MLPASPKVIERSLPGHVTIEWTDGVKDAFSAADLRRVCPCAACVSETTGQRMHDPATVSDDVQQAELSLVGNYAITMHFSDGHSTGIFTFQFLRQLGQDLSAE